MNYERNKRFFLIYTLVILILLVVRLAFGSLMSDLWQGLTLASIVLLSLLELILMKVLK